MIPAVPPRRPPNQDLPPPAEFTLPPVPKGCIIVYHPIEKNGRLMHGLNGGILVWNHSPKRRDELTFMGIQVISETLVDQLKRTEQEHFPEMPHHKAIMNNEIPLSIGGGIGQSRVYSLLLRKVHLGECSVTVWPKVLKDMCARKNIHVLQ